ncbi:Type-1 restriction enzyme MjaXIP specificity protein [uncultured archaeon]|nr:Type-1 restriction enzyme MjaXIP specificity protein [uncultured archaeon]
MKTQTKTIEWREVELGNEDICEIAGEYGSGASAKKYDGEIRYIRITDIDENGKLRDEKVSPSKIEEKYLLKKGDLLFARSGATVGKTHLFIGDGSKSLYAGYLIRFRFNKDKIDPNYIYYYTRTPKYLSWVKSKMKVVAQPNINSRQYSSIKIPIPFNEDKSDLKEQEKIVKILEKAEKLKERGKNANELLDEYLKSVFNELFYNNSFQEVKLSDICETSSGGTPSRTKQEYWSNGKIPWIKSGDLNKDKITEVNEFITESGLKNSSAKYIEPNTILIAMYGATAGITSISKIRATTNQAVCALVPKDKKLNEIYLLYWLRSKYEYIVSLSFGGGQPNISQQVIRSLMIPIPPLPLQEKFTKIVNEIEKMKENVKKTESNSEELFNSLIQKSFRGEL